MNTLRQAVTVGQAIILGVVVIGCATAASITGHLPSGDYVGIVGAVLAGGGIIGTAHVVGTQVNTAASGSGASLTDAAASPPATGPGQPTPPAPPAPVTI